MYPLFTLVSTVFNEKNRIEQTIKDIQAQTVQPAEIIITDAGSSDGTYEALLEWKAASPVPVRVLRVPKCNVAQGRNLAIKTARHALIVSTDFGCRFAEKWLESLVAPFADPAVKAVGGAYGVLEDDIITVPARAAYIMAGGYHPDVTASWFIPSSRSIAYYKEVFNKAGGYCEWLTLAGDDEVFGKLVKAAGYHFFPAGYKGVYWGRHTTAKGYVKEAFRYGLGNGEARVNRRNFLSNSIELLLRYAFFALLLAGIPLAVTGILPLWMVGLLLLVCSPGLRSYINYGKTWQQLKSSKYNRQVFIYGFWLQERTKLSYVRGYIKGFLFAWSNQKMAANALNHRLYQARFVNRYHTDLIPE